MPNGRDPATPPTRAHTAGGGPSRDSGSPPAEPGPEFQRRFAIVAGHPTAEELAALTVALSAVLARRPRRALGGRRRSAWADRSALLCAPLTPGPDAWRRSARSPW